MPLMNVIEVLANSPDVFDKTAEVAVTKASETVQNIKSLFMKEMNAKAENGKIISYGVNAETTFGVGGQSPTWTGSHILG